MTSVVVRICRETKQPELFFYNQTDDGRRTWLECYTVREGHSEASVEYMRRKTRPAETDDENVECVRLALRWSRLPGDATPAKIVKRLQRPRVIRYP